MKNVLALSGLAVTAAGLGGVAGYFLAQRRLEQKFNKELDVQIKEAKEHYKGLSTITTEKPYSSPEEAVAALIPETPKNVQAALKTYGGHTMPAPRTIAPVVIDEALEEEESGTVIREVVQPKDQNIFAAPPVTIDLGESVREPGRPYTITEEDFMQNEHDFAQTTFTYYAGDRILANTRDEVMDQVNQIVGHANLEKIQDLPEDKNTLYVRNEKYDSDYEIVVSMGKYSVEVAGLDE